MRVFAFNCFTVKYKSAILFCNNFFFLMNGGGFKIMLRINNIIFFLQSDSFINNIVFILIKKNITLQFMIILHSIKYSFGKLYRKNIATNTPSGANRSL